MPVENTDKEESGYGGGDIDEDIEKGGAGAKRSGGRVAVAGNQFAAAHQRSQSRDDGVVQQGPVHDRFRRQSRVNIPRQSRGLYQVGPSKGPNEPLIRPRPSATFSPREKEKTIWLFPSPLGREGLARPEVRDHFGSCQTSTATPAEAGDLSTDWIYSAKQVAEICDVVFQSQARIIHALVLNLNRAVVFAFPQRLQNLSYGNDPGIERRPCVPAAVITF